MTLLLCYRIKTKNDLILRRFIDIKVYKALEIFKKYLYFTAYPVDFPNFFCKYKQLGLYVGPDVDFNFLLFEYFINVVNAVIIVITIQKKFVNYFHPCFKAISVLNTIYKFN